MSMHYDSESLVDRGRSPRLFALLVIIFIIETKEA